MMGNLSFTLTEVHRSREQFRTRFYATSYWAYADADAKREARCGTLPYVFSLHRPWHMLDGRGDHPPVCTSVTVLGLVTTASTIIGGALPLDSYGFRYLTALDA